MNKLITVYDDKEPLNNVVCELTLDLDEVFYIYHHDKPKHSFKYIKKVINDRKDIKINFIKPKDDKKTINDILNKNKNVIVDVGGAKYLSLLLLQYSINRNNKIIYYDDEENVIKDFRNHSVLKKDVVKLTIEEIICLRGGTIEKNKDHQVELTETRNLINKTIESNINNYSNFTEYLSRIRSVIRRSTKLNSTTYRIRKEDAYALKSEAAYQKSQNIIKVEKDQLKFKNYEIAHMVAVTGTFLENYLYQQVIKTKIFDDARVSANVIFADEKFERRVRCEIDMLLIKNNHLMFISIKSNKIDQDDLYEIYSHNAKFGNALSAPVICLCDDADRKSPDIYLKAQELGVYVIDKSNIQEKDFPEVFNKIVEGTYVYDDVMNKR